MKATSTHSNPRNAAKNQSNPRKPTLNTSRMSNQEHKARMSWILAGIGEGVGGRGGGERQRKGERREREAATTTTGEVAIGDSAKQVGCQ
ncbi:Os10g0362400 [Oryza sativa Japonica Group]|uniref:Os10g0362400 protein n=1 Tax=Oryza sativa subsp. japonica TaxID=39947 RepID=A0A0P0XTG6_ORYSJ|nr:Os10g0362400 [Oryza sativa Japonica Group]